MSNFQSPVGTTQDFIPVVPPTKIGSYWGLRMVFPSYAVFQAAVATMQTVVGLGKAGWADGQEMAVASELQGGGCYRLWSSGLTNSNTVVVRNGLAIVLAGDTNVLLFGAGQPSDGTGNDGDVSIDWAGNHYYTKAAGSWSSTGTLYSGGGGASAFTDLTDAPHSYTGHAKQTAHVNDAEDGLVFDGVVQLDSANVGATGADIYSNVYPGYGLLSAFNLNGLNANAAVFTTQIDSSVSTPATNVGAIVNAFTADTQTDAFSYLQGLQVFTDHTGSGVVDGEISALRVTALNEQSNSPSANVYGLVASSYTAGPVNRTASIFIEYSTQDGGTDNYALLIGDATGSTNNWAIKTGLGLVEFGDRVQAASANVGGTGTDVYGFNYPGAGSLTTYNLNNRAGNAAVLTTQVDSSVSTPSFVSGAIIAAFTDPSQSDAFSYLEGLQIYADHYGSGALDGSITGAYVYGYNDNSNSPSANIFGVIVGATNYSGATVNRTAAIYVEGAHQQGTVTNNYGILVNDATGATNNWAIKTGLGLVEFGDQLKIITADGATLLVDDSGDGDIVMTAGGGGGGGSTVFLNGGSGTAGGAAGGAVQALGGPNFAGTATGAKIYAFAADANDGGVAQIFGGNSSTRDGAPVDIAGGNGLRNGGDISIGAGSGGTANGNIILSGLPTSASGLPSGAVWNSSGVLHIV